MARNLISNVLIGKTLVNEGLISFSELERGLTEQKNSGEFICSTLIKLGLVSEKEMFTILSRQVNISFVELNNRNIAREVIQKIPVKLASYYKIIPLEFKDSCLTVAMNNPENFSALDDIKLFLGFEVKGVLAGALDIQEAMHKYFGLGVDTLEQIAAQGQKFEKAVKDELKDSQVLSEDASITKFVNQILSEAVKQRATDIHLEPFQNELQVRFRIDGLLYDANIPESIKDFYPAIVSRIKIMANLDIAEHRLPHDGKMKLKVDRKELDLRVSILSTAYGEAVQIRILPSQLLLKLDKLGLSRLDFEIIQRMLKKPHGIIFATGPTGSGKSTTLYSCLTEINSSTVKIITIEDPIECQLKGINQIQVIPKIGFTFTVGLRHMLRHDPDVMMIGEVRDYETAEIAIRAALTGHLVFSTLHTNSAAGAATRLLDMGIDPFLIASSLECLVAQRLVRLICSKCKTPVKSKTELIKQAQGRQVDFKDIELYEGKGCQECRFTGYSGRTGVYEVLTVSESIRKLILDRASSQQIEEKAVAEGMHTLAQDGLDKVSKGLTTIAEVNRVAKG